MELVELEEKSTMSREEAAARLHAIADELASNNDFVDERERLRVRRVQPVDVLHGDRVVADPDCDSIAAVGAGARLRLEGAAALR